MFLISLVWKRARDIRYRTRFLKRERNKRENFAENFILSRKKVYSYFINVSRGFIIGCDRGNAGKSRGTKTKFNSRSWCLSFSDLLLKCDVNGILLARGAKVINIYTRERSAHVAREFGR